jgi:glycosyltransferase involved in cell wall biosynthesis
MNITYIAEFDTTDITKRSGLGVNIAKALKDNGNDLQYMDKLSATPPVSAYLKKVFYWTMKKRYDFMRERWYAEQLSHIVQTQHEQSTDLFFSLSSQPIAFLESKKPKVFYTDATFAQMIGFYFNNLSKDSIIHGNEVERIALHNSDLAIYASQWAADSAINDYGVDAAKVKVVPRGANIECDRTSEDIKTIVENRTQDVIKLLFVGIDWYRKGGETAYQIVKSLNDNNIRAELHVVGLSSIPLNPLPKYIINHGFLNKSNSDHSLVLDQLYLDSHFFLLPTLADTFGIVFGEANSFGLPAISFNVGGIASVILNDVNGYCFNPDVDVKHIAEYIKEVFFDKIRYMELCKSSFNEYSERLNWSTSGTKIQALLTDLL